MKLSYNPEGQEPNRFPVNGWEPNDFLTKSLVEGPASPEPDKSVQAGVKGKKVRSLQDALTLLQPSLVKLPIVDSPRYKKVIRSQDLKNLISPWTPQNLSDKDENSAENQSSESNNPDEKGLTEEEIAQRKTLIDDFERKIAESSELISQNQKQAEEILAQAKTQSEQKIAEAESQSNQIRQKAYEEGLASARVENEKLVQQITAMIKETQNWQNRVLEQSEQTIIEIVQVISKKLFGSGFALNTENVEQMVGRAINEANRLGNLRIYVNPEDHALLISLWQESDLVVNGQKIQLIPSQNILRGGSFVEGDFGSVDSRIDKQLEILENELNHTLANREQEKQRQLEMNPPENINLENKAIPVDNFGSLDHIQINLAADVPLSVENQVEDYGNSIPAQPE